MTTTSADAAYDADNDADKGGELATVASDAALSGLRRLHPVDGLFLRAEHLDQIQTYAAELNRLTSVAGGSGTVFGLELELEVDTSGRTRLHASPGLAISDTGRPLRGLTTMEVDLDGLETDVAQRVWVVEVVPAEDIMSGSEPAYSSVCATSCGPGASIHPWRDDAVRLRVRAEKLEGDWETPAVRRRSALASAWFERERVAGSPWLTPRAAGGPVDSLFSRPWSRPAPDQAPSGVAVPLGLLFREDQRWAMDVWAARRDRAAPPPQSAWPPHLGMRGWSTYMAHVLQFEHHVRSLGDAADLADHLVELPPGGFVDVAQIKLLLSARDDGDAHVRLIHCTADVAISAVALAQHLDRIPITSDADVLAEIDVWIPSRSADLPQLRTGEYPWVAFTRGVRAEIERQKYPEDRAISLTTLADAFGSGYRSSPRPVEVDDEDDDIAVYVVEAPRDRSRYSASIEQVEDSPAGRVAFAAGTWSLTSTGSVPALRGLVSGAGRIDVVASAADPGQAALMVARARSLAEEVGLAEDGQTAVYSVHRDGPESIYLMVRS